MKPEGLATQTKNGNKLTSLGNLSMAEIDRRCEVLVAREREAGNTPDTGVKVRRVDPKTLRGEA
jgi:hypothetical protein